MQPTEPHPTRNDSPELTHIDPQGRARMVDVGGKAVSHRTAIATGSVRISEALAKRIADNNLAKGSLLDVARLAGVMAAKRTDELIPLCHGLPLDHVDVAARVEGNRVHLKATASTTARTGIEMEALTAVSVAALTVIDMGKAIDPAMVIEEIKLIEKRGGRRGTIRPHDTPDGTTHA
ncbi:MAG: cyclic pyranopterin monophosphate synthase MoaC [Phycisphaerales bacterium JB063]